MSTNTLAAGISPSLQTQNKNRQCMYKHNSGVRSHNHCRSGKAISITYSECESVALVTQHASICTILSSVVCLAPPYCSTLSHTEQKMRVLIFSTSLCATFLILRRTEHNSIIKVCRSSCKVPGI